MYRTKKRVFGLLLGTLLALGGAVLGQDDTCPAIVQTALETVDSLCVETGRNQACYGNILVTVTTQADVYHLEFDAPGDKGDVAMMKSLTLSAMDETTDEWGMALMKLQANLPDSLPGQNVTVLLFGDVQVRNLFDNTPESYAPMQAFTFQSGIGDSPCKEAPDSGILIQTPQGAGEVRFVVNEVEISLGSTAYLQAAPGDALVVTLLEGQATVTAFEKTRTVPAGAVISVPLDADLAASGPPGEPEPYTLETVESLAGVIAVLPEAITPSEPAAAETIPDKGGTCVVAAGGAVNLRSGPGTNYARAGGLAADESANPTGRVQGMDGYTWWQLAGGNWVRADVVQASGLCDSLPVVTDLPPTPTPIPVPVVTGGDTSSGTDYFFPFRYDVWRCSVRNGYPFRVGQPVEFHQGGRTFPSYEEAQAASWTPVFVLDGVPLTSVVVNEIADNSDQGYTVLSYYRIEAADWIATAGTHTIYADWGEGMNQPFNTTCTFTVEG